MRNQITALLILFSLSFLSAQTKVEEFLSLSDLEKIKVGKKIMEIELPSIDGKGFNFNDLNGNYILINFWATWCAPCIKNLPFFNSLIKRYNKDNIKFVFVSVDKDKDKWKNYVQGKELKGIHLIAPEGIKTKPICYFLNRIYEKDGQITANERGVPRYVLIDPTGVIVYNDLEKKSNEEINELIKKILK